MQLFMFHKHFRISSLRHSRTHTHTQKLVWDCTGSVDLVGLGWTDILQFTRLCVSEYDVFLHLLGLLKYLSIIFNDFLHRAPFYPFFKDLLLGVL